MKTDQDRLARVLKIAQADAWGLVAVAGPSGVIAAFSGEFFVAGCAAIVTGAGLLELSGRTALARGDARGLHRLWSAQLAALACILVYAVWRWNHAADPALLAHLPAFVRTTLDEAFPDPAELSDLLATLQETLAVIVGGVALLYQGGMVVFYLREKAAVRRALAAPAVPPKT